MKNAIKIIILSLIFGGISGVVLDRFFLPYLASLDAFKKYEFLKGAVENTTIINKTEEITVKDDESTFELLNRVGSAVVSIVDVEDRTLGSGVVLTSDGMVVTSRDVLYNGEEEKEFFVVFHDSSRVKPVSVKKNDKFAVAKVDKTNLSVANIANEARSGERLIVLGRGTREEKEIISAGMVNYLDTSNSNMYTSIKNYPALWGAPLFNLKGEAVGLNIANKEEVVGILFPKVSELLAIQNNTN